MSELVQYEVRDDAAWITLNRPERLNALSDALCEGLLDAVQRAAADEAARMVVLGAAGRFFCAGADVKERGGGAVSRGPGGETAFSRASRALWELPKPVIGRVQGGAYGGGLGLMACCDITVAAGGAHFAFSEVRLGVIPAVISVYVLRKVALADASELMLTGERFGAEYARRIGLAHHVVDAEALDDAVWERCSVLRECGPRALQEVKRLLRTVPGLDIPTGLDWADGKNQELFNSAEAAEGMGAFAEKRKPSWAPET